MARVRKLKLDKAVAAAPVATPKAAPKAAAKKTVAKVAAAPRPARVVHAVAQPYAGQSPVFNVNKSRTALPVAEFGTMPDLVLSERSQALLGALKAEYGAKPFPVGNADRGIIKFAIRKGHITHVGGDPNLESCQFQFTKAAMATKYAAS